MGNINSSKVDFEYIQRSIQSNDNSYIMINVLEEQLQHCLIKETIFATEEEDIINNYIKTNKNINIIIYGKNCTDEKLLKKYKQLRGYGFKNVFVYVGGLFEWLCLQDIYGADKFQTTGHESDLLKYK